MLRKLLFLFATALLLIAQTTSPKEKKEEMEMCGGKGHECSCVRRTNRIKEKKIDDCRKAGGSATTCLLQIPMDDCDLVETQEYGEEGGEENYGFNFKTPEMSDWCARNCKMHDCKCGDKATCHVLHQASDHNPKTKTAPKK